ncbi:MAG: OsmC family protein [Deltaproteobacteria bacterium]|nr:OsmC family protein [Deltaproteobacteria bacterium]
MSIELKVEEGYRFAVTCREHTVIIDQPVKEGGTNQGMDPVEHFITSLSGCVGFYAVNFMNRKKITTGGFRVTADWEMAKNPYRIGKIRMTLHLPAGFPAEQQEALLAVCRGCTLHHTLEQGPVTEYAIREG